MVITFSGSLPSIFSAISTVNDEGGLCYHILRIDGTMIRIPFVTIEEAKDVFEWLHSVSGKLGGKRRRAVRPKGIIFALPLPKKDIRSYLRQCRLNDYFVMNKHLEPHQNAIRNPL